MKRYIVITDYCKTVQTDTLTDDQILDCKDGLASIFDTHKGTEMNPIGCWIPIEEV